MKKRKTFISSLKVFMGERVKTIIIFFLFPFRNRFILLNPFKRAKQDCVNLNYWDDLDNLGDALSPIIVQYVLSKRHNNWEKKRLDSSHYLHLYAIGSIITAGIQDCTVWGSGFLSTNKINRLKGRKIDVRAVRGPLSKVVLSDNGITCPSVYGDPAILLPLIYRPQTIKKKYKYGIIKHLGGANESMRDDITFINIMTKDYKEFVDSILQVECVISSSLHGIILAESYGVPALLLKPSHDLFKYYDWYFSTLRCDFPIANSIEEAMHLTPPELPKNLIELREGLLNTFPYDLFCSN